MKHIELDGEGEQSSGLMALLVTVMELLVETMEREAVRRMESGQLSPQEIERLGAQLQAINEEIEEIKERNELEDDVEVLRDDLDSLVSEAVEQVHERELHQ